MSGGGPVKRDWKPGDVALIRVGTGDWELGLRQDNGAWACQHAGTRREWEEVQASRPVVVIDPEDREQVERLASAYERDHEPGETAFRDMGNALRSLIADPKPDEPTGLGAVVEDADGADWHRTRDGRWIAEDGLRSRACGWGHITAVKVLSDGVTP